MKHCYSVGECEAVQAKYAELLHCAVELARWIARHDDVCPLGEEGAAALANLPPAVKAEMEAQ